jgi:hypothetical protein
VLAGCSQGLPVPPPEPQPTGSAYFACANLKAALPEQVLGHNTTATEPWSSLTTAWGNPAIVLRCGVPAPAALTPTAQLVTIDDVAWFPEPLERGYLFTTYGREVNVEVSVPSEYSPEADALTEISRSVAETIPAAAPSPSPSAS